MYAKRLTNFGIKIYGVSPNEVKVNSEYSIDVSSEEPTGGMLVPKYEENSVRQELKYSIADWRKLSPAERAEEIAIKRINQKIEYAKFLKSIGKI